MNILMMTNSYEPFVGGVTSSINTFARDYRAIGHRVLIAAPAYPHYPSREEGVVRIPAMDNHGADDSAGLPPMPPALEAALGDFRPHLVHSHHPYLLGATALGVSMRLRLPIVYTFHTFYEKYTHYVAEGSARLLQWFIKKAVARYAGLCDAVIAPSRFAAHELEERGVAVPIHVIPTGVDCLLFAQGDRYALRRRLGLSPETFVAGFVSRLGHEKNPDFLMRSIARFLNRRPGARFLVVGSGPAEEEMRAWARDARVETRVLFLGRREGRDLVDALHAMDVFAFASKTETQGLVLAEAMAAGVPVVALEAPAVGEMVRDGDNGILVRREDEESFAAALEEVYCSSASRRSSLSLQARLTAARFSRRECAAAALRLYAGAAASARRSPEAEAEYRKRVRTQLRLERGTFRLMGYGTEKALNDFRDSIARAQHV